MIKQRGQTLIEILLAFSVSVMVLSAIVISVAGSLSNAQYTKNQNLANAYAQEGLAIVRQLRDSDWKTFVPVTAEAYYCINASNVLVSYDGDECRTTGNKIGIFARSVTIDRDSPLAECSVETPTPAPTIIPGTVTPQNSKVTVTVAWSDNKCPSAGNTYCHSVNLVSCLSNINRTETP